MNASQSLMLRIVVNASQVAREADRAIGTLSKMQSRMAKMASARDALGIRSERAIQREILRTEAAYQRLARSGQLSARETARAYDAMRGKVRQLRAEMEGVTRAQRAMSMGRGALAVGAGVGAGAYVMMQPVKRTMDFDRQLAMASNTIYADRASVAGRTAGSRSIDEAVKRAVRAGGGDREGAIEALQAMVASGAMGDGDAGRAAVFGLLPTLQKYHTGTGADTADLARIAASAKLFGVDVKNMPYALDMGIRAGDLGGMELRDQAKWLPQQMALARKIGMSGEQGLAKLMAANQASFLTAGTTDQAGNNLVNLLNKINSQDTAADAKKQGINLSGELMKARAQGVDAIDAFVALADRVVGKNKRYRALQAELANTSDEGQRREILQAQTAIIEGSAIGKILQDQQAASALAGIMGNRDFVRKVEQGALGARGAGDLNFGTIAATASYQVERAQNEKAFAESEAMRGLTKVIGDTADKVADYAQQYPGLTASVVGATTALAALAAAAGASALTGVLSGGATRGAAGALAGAARSPAGLAAVAGLGGYGVGTLINKGLGELTGGGEGWLGGWLFDKIHGDELAELNKPIARAAPADVNMQGTIKVSVDLQNNTASVTPQFDDRRLNELLGSGRTMPMVTAGIRG